MNKLIYILSVFSFFICGVSAESDLNAIYETKHFELYYDKNITGEKYVKKAGKYLEEAWDYFVKEKGKKGGKYAIFKSPPLDGPHKKLVVVVGPETNKAGDPGLVLRSKGSFLMKLRNNLSDEPLREVCFHEFFHCIQFAYKTKTISWLDEGTAVWAESVAPIKHKICFNAASYHIAGANTLPIDYPNKIYRYGSFLFFKYIDENASRYNPEYSNSSGCIIRNIYKNISDGSMRAVAIALGGKNLKTSGESFRKALLEFAAANVLKKGKENYPYIHWRGEKIKSDIKLERLFAGAGFRYCDSFSKFTGEISPREIRIKYPFQIKYYFVKPPENLKEPTSLQIVLKLDDKNKEYDPDFFMGVLEKYQDKKVKLVIPKFDAGYRAYIYRNANFGASGMREAVVLIGRSPDGPETVFIPVKEKQSPIDRAIELQKEDLSKAAFLKAAIGEPLFLKRVFIYQSGRKIYEAFWKDETNVRADGRQTIVKRELIKETDDCLKVGPGALDAEITLEFSRPLSEKPYCRLGRLTLDFEEGANKKLWTAKVKCGNLEEAQEIELIANAPFSEEAGLDANPATPCSIGVRSIGWIGYEGKEKPIGGSDEVHKIKASPRPPIVKNISVVADGKFYLAKSCVRRYKTGKVAIVDDSNYFVEDLPLNPKATKEGLLKIEFSSDVADDSVKVLFGALSVPMKKVGDKIYEGKITFDRLPPNTEGEVKFSINATGKRGLPLDGNPLTPAHMSKSSGEWEGHDKLPETNYGLMISYKTENPVLRGFLCEVESVKRPNPAWADYEGLMQLRSSLYGVFPVVKRPLNNFNVYLALQYCVIPDERLLGKVMKLLRSKMNVNRKMEKGIRKISLSEYKDNLELQGLKEKVKACAKYYSGRKPEWRTKTDNNGEYFFELEKYPGKDGVIHLAAMTTFCPELGKETYFAAMNFPSCTSYYPGFTNFWGRCNKQINSPDFEYLSEAKFIEFKRLKDSMKEQRAKLENARSALEKLKAEWEKWPGHIERSWKERALKDQRNLEQECIKKHGPALNWTPEVRKSFEKALYEQPGLSRKSWENDVKEFMEKREIAIRNGEEALGKCERVLMEIEKELQAIRDERVELLSKYSKKAYDIVSSASVDPQFKYLRVFEELGNFSGDSITPETKVGFHTGVYLIKQDIDEKIYPRENRGFFDKQPGWAGIQIDLNNPRKDEYKPPFTFKLKQGPVDNYLKLRFFYKNANPGRAPEKIVGAGPIETIFWGNCFMDMQKRTCIDTVWRSNVIPPWVEIDGYPIKEKDRKRFDELWDRLEIITFEREKIDKGLLKVGDDFRAGKISYEEADKRKKESYKRSMDLGRETMKIYSECLSLNPAFSPEARKKILGR